MGKTLLVLGLGRRVDLLQGTTLPSVIQQVIVCRGGPRGGFGALSRVSGNAVIQGIPVLLDLVLNV
jgi:hypothetical protein